MKPPVVDLSQELFLWTSNQVRWTQLELDHSVNFSDLITLFSDKLVPVTTGLRVIILKVLNLLIQFSMLLEKKLKVAIASKDSKYATPSVVVLDLVWVHSLFLKLEKNILIELWQLSQSSHHQKYPILLLNHIMLHFLYINSLRTQINVKSSIMKPYMISASELLNLPPQPMVTWTISSPLLCPVLHAQSDSQVNLTLISEN